MFGRDAINLLVTQLQSVTGGFTPAVTVAAGWPTLDFLTNSVAKSAATAVSIYDHGPSRDASRFMLYTANEVLTAPGIAAAVSQNFIVVNGTATVTLGGSVTLNDAVAFVVSSSAVSAPQVVIVEAATGATLASMAQALTSGINSDLVGLVSATVSGSVLTVTNTSTSSIQIAANVGNLGTRYTEVDREIRQVQVDVWAPTDAIRTAVSRPIDQQLGYLDAHFGMQGVGGTTDDGTWVRVRRLSSQFIDRDVLSDVYRWMWHVTLEYGITYEEQLYSVLSFIPSIQQGFGGLTIDSPTTVDGGQPI